MPDWIVFGILWVIFSAIGEWAVHLLIHAGTYFYIDSSIAAGGERAFNFLFTMLTPIFVFVVLVLIYAFFRFRAKSGETGDAEIQIRHNKPYVGGWITLSVVINLLFFLHPTTSALQSFFKSQNPKASANRHALVVDVVARQWEWIFNYPQYGIKQAVNRYGNDVLYVQKGRPVKFVLRSYDPFHRYDTYLPVIHSFWVPAWGIKEDVIPGETRTVYITPTKIASYNTSPLVRVQCAEVCGPGHPYMEAPLHVVSSSQFSAWVRHEKALQNG